MSHMNVCNVWNRRVRLCHVAVWTIFYPSGFAFTTVYIFQIYISSVFCWVWKYTWTSLYKGSRYCTTLAECVELSNIETSFKPSMWEFLRKSVAYSDRWPQWVSPKSYNKEGTWMWLTDSMTSNSYSLRKESLSMKTSLPDPWSRKEKQVTWGIFFLSRKAISLTRQACSKSY